MNTSLIWNNLVAYSLQVGVLVGLAAFVPTLLRMRMPHARLAYWHLLLLACLAMPAVRPWRQAAYTATVNVTHVVSQTRPVLAPQHAIPAACDLLLLLVALGVAGRLGWLGIGLWRLGRYRRHACPYGEPLSQVELLVSDEISSPVTFGFRRPVILLPARFAELSAGMREAILCHETLHVARHDWLFTVGEELIRAIFWFHPAIWWLLAEIQLAREQAVDRLVIEATRSRDCYVDALLAIAGARPTLDLAPAPLLLRKRHLKQRVVGILREVRMSKTRWISALAAALAIMAAACWFVTGAIPLAAEPQMVTDAPGVTVDTNGAALMHRTAVPYPEQAMAKGIQGTVVVQVKLDSSGEVADASIVSGPDELRRDVLQSVLNWHFMKDVANTSRTVNIDFVLPPGQPPAGQTPRAIALIGQAVRATAPGAELKLQKIEINGLSDQARDELLAALPVHVGDAITQDIMPKILLAVHQFDSHLSVNLAYGDTTLQISAPAVVLHGIIGLAGAAPPPPPPPPQTTTVPQQIRVGGNVQMANLLSGPKPSYPPEAKTAQISGTVRLEAVLNKDGTVQSLTVLSGHPLLVQAALDAVKNWVYRPTLLNGQPVEVKTTIDINFTLAQ